VRLFYAELLKIRTAPRTSLGLTLGLLLLTGLGSASTAYDVDSNMPFGNELGLVDVIRVVSIAPVFTLILGILVVTWEYRHGTITQTFLATPRRERVIGAKDAVSFLAGAVVAALALALALLVASFWISLDFEREHWELAGRMVFAAAIWGVLGAGLGALMQSQVGAIVTSFVWFLVAEPLLGVTIDALTDTSITDYLPGNVLDRLMNTTGSIEVGSGEDILGPDYAFGLWTAALFAVGYAGLFAVLGLVSALKRDVP
jgi:ABC-2 type transport system permease protein